MKHNIKRIISNFEEILAGGFLIATTGVVIINVFMRYFLNSGFFWTEEVATGCFVWAVFLGSSACYKRKMHVGINVIINALSPKGKIIAKIIVDLVLVFINSYIFWISVEYLKISSRKPTPVLDISSAYISSSITVSFFLMSVYSVLFLIRDVKNSKKEGE